MNHAHGDTTSSRNRFREPTSLTSRIVELITSNFPVLSKQWNTYNPRVEGGSKAGTGLYRRVLTLVNVLIFAWIITVYWGERTVFKRSIDSCDWRHWESWPKDAQPHRVAFVADPQLVDPHTYPGRPWPLSTLTIRYTDLYLKRVYRLMQVNLYPDSTIFLGDLFDGGREWSVASKWNNPDKSWKRYGEKFWLKEYDRFGKIFFDTFTRSGVAPREVQRKRRQLIASLPGNHDLGFANGVHKPVRERFSAYFGEGNRVDVIGNHSFVSIDGVSLSAKDLPEGGDEEIWKPAVDFLNKLQSSRNKAVAEAMRIIHGASSRPRYKHVTLDVQDLASADLPTVRDMKDAKLPTILLSHVPLYRDSGTPCGPYRERWPPTLDQDGKPLERDERNALSITAGYQYQNVLSADLTKDITTKIGDIQYAFSGDDHDYCEVVHRRYPSGGGGIREITVKSISWAMGVRKPGFELVSLWNPVDSNGVPFKVEGADKGTLQSHLCLLPDQLAIFIRYGLLLIVTLSLLLFRAGHMASNPAKSAFAGSESPLLPTVRDQDDERGESSSSDDNGITSLSLNSRAKGSHSKGGYGLPPATNGPAIPLVSYTGYYGSPEGKTEPIQDYHVYVSKARKLKGLALFNAELRWSIIRVASVVLPFYFWLIWTG